MEINLHLLSVFGFVLAAMYLQFTGINDSFAIQVIRILLASLGGIICGFFIVLRNSKYKKAVVPDKPKSAREMSDFIDEICKTQFHSPYKHSTVVTNTIDKEIQEIFDLFVRDFCLSWFRNLGKDENTFKDTLTKDLWDVTKNLVTKLRNVDIVKLLSNDLVNLMCTHFQELRLSNKRKYPGTAKSFALHPCLSSSKEELKYLRIVSEVMIYAFLSKKNSESSPLRLLFREILAYSVFQPMFDKLCDPDYINQTLLLYLESKEKLTKSHGKDYAYAETYEDFIRLINTSQDIEHVKGLR